MDSPFDIAADLDTPVSAYMKLRPFDPKFLLESVESGERLARYSIIGLRAALTIERAAARRGPHDRAPRRSACARRQAGRAPEEFRRVARVDARRARPLAQARAGHRR